jgi:hypothetical protein
MLRKSGKSVVAEEGMRVQREKEGTVVEKEKKGIK